jgi:hypothetical protein
MSKLIYLIELDCAVDNVGTVQTLYFSSGNYVTGPGETPASTAYIPRITQPGNLARMMFQDATTAGQSQVSYGTCEIENIDASLDYILGYSLDKRKLRLLVGDPAKPYNTFTLAQRITMQQPEVTYKSLSIILRDRQLELDMPLCANLYGGTNVLPAGKDGAADIAGSPIPRLYGTALNFVPILCNTSLLIYQVHDGAIATVSNVYDSGNALTRGADYTTLADVEATAPATGQYRVYPPGGYFRLGSDPTGQLTCDASQGATVANRTCAQILKQVALDMGLPATDISVADVAGLDALNSAECGVWVQDTSTGLTVMDQVAQSVGAYFGFDRLGNLRMARLDVPSGAPVITFSNINVADIDRVRSNDSNNGIPAYRVTLTYAKNYTVQTSGLAGAVTPARALVLKQPSQTSMGQDLTVRTKYLWAAAMTRDTLLVNKADADAEAARLLGIFKVSRNMYTLNVKLDQPTIAAIDLGVVVSVQVPRFGMNSGALLRVLGITADYASNSATLTLWR